MRCAECGTQYADNLVACPQCGSRGFGELRRPGAVTFLGVLNVLGGLLLLLVAAALAFFRTKVPLEAQVYMIGGAVGVAVLALLHLACGSGLLKLRSYGRVLLIIFAGLGLLNFPFGTVFSILILIYMLKPGMRILFSERPASLLRPEEAAAVGDVQRSGLGTAIIVFCVVALGGSLIFVPIAAIAIPNLLNAVQRGKEKRTMADMRTLATAVEAYEIENDEYPEADGVEELVSMILREDLSVLSKVDGWGHEFRYQARGGSYAIASAGKDGEWEVDDLFDYEAGTAEGFEGDIVLGDGSFVRTSVGPQDGAEWPPEEAASEDEAASLDSATPPGGMPVQLTLQLLDWRMRKEGKEAILEGAVVNLSPVVVEDATVVAVFVTEEGAEVTTASAPLRRLEPGGTTPFTVRTPLHPAMFTATLSITDVDDNVIPLVSAEPLPEADAPADLELQEPEPAPEEEAPEVLPEDEP